MILIFITSLKHFLSHEFKNIKIEQNLHAPCNQHLQPQQQLFTTSGFS